MSDQQPMQQPPQNQQQNVYQSSNMGFNNSNALQVRLNTQPLMEAIEDFLRGSKINYVPNEETKQIDVQKIKFGDRMANDAGIQNILLKVSTICNPQVVQGFFSQQEYESYIQRVHQNLALLIVSKRNKWDINKEDMSLICDFIMELLEPFVSRLKDNTERDSYANTIRSIETNNQQSKGWGMPFPFRG